MIQFRWRGRRYRVPSAWSLWTIRGVTFRRLPRGQVEYSLLLANTRRQGRWLALHTVDLTTTRAVGASSQRGRWARGSTAHQSEPHQIVNVDPVVASAYWRKRNELNKPQP